MNTLQLNPHHQPHRPMARDLRLFFVGFGLSFVGIGGLAFGHLATANMISTFIIGMIILSGALLHLGQAFAVRRSEASGLWAASGIFYLLAGVSILIEPVLDIRSLTLVLAVTLAISGMARLVLGIRHAAEWVIFSGATSILAGTVIAMDWPRNALFMVAILVAADLLIQGITLLGTGLTGRFTIALSDEEL